MKHSSLLIVLSSFILAANHSSALAEFYQFEGKLTVEAFVGSGCEKKGAKAGRQFDVAISVQSTVPLTISSTAKPMNEPLLTGYLISEKLNSGRFKGALGALTPFEVTAPTEAQSLGHSVTVRVSAGKTIFSFKEKAPDPRLDECQWELATFEGVPKAQGTEAESRFEKAQEEFDQDMAHVQAARKDPEGVKKLLDLLGNSQRLAVEKKHAAAAQLIGEAQVLIEKLYPRSWISQGNLSNWGVQLEEIGDLPKAVLMQTESLRLSQLLYKPNDKRIEDASLTLARLLQASNRDKEAVPLRLAAISIIEKNGGPEQLDLAVQINNLGMLYRYLNDSPRALSAFERALTIAQKTEGKPHRTTGIILNNLGTINIRLARYAEALSQITRALEITEAIHGRDHVNTVNSLNNLALIHERMGELRLALPLYQRAVTIRETKLAPDHADTAVSLNNLGLLLESLGRFNEALTVVQRALAIAEKTDGSQGENTGNRLNSLAGIYRNMGQYAQALPLYERALKIIETLEGESSSDVATTLANLSVTLKDLNQYPRALLLAERALAISEKVDGPQHPLTGNRLNNLSYLYQVTGQYDKAMALMKKSLAISENVEGPNHLNTGSRLSNLGALYISLGQYQTAVPLLNRALAIAEKSEGPEHPNTGIRANNLASAYLDLSQYGLALPLFNRALAITEKSLGKDHPDVGGRLVNIAVLLRRMGQYEQALPFALRAVQIANNSVGADSTAAATALNNLGLIYEYTAQPEKALVAYQGALATAEKLLGTSHATISVYLNNLAEHYRTSNQVALAVPLYERALKISEQAEGIDHPSTASRLNNLALIYETVEPPNRANTTGGKEHRSIALYLRAYAISVRSGDVAMSKTIQGNIARLYRAQNQSELAILFGKEAVNSIQTLRANSRGIDSSAQQSLLAVNKSTYEDLAKWLIEAGRVSEAQQVIGMLKEDELQGFTLASGAQDPRRSTIQFSGPEVLWHEQTRNAAAELNRLAQRIEELNKITPEVRSAQQKTELIEVSKRLLVAQQQFNSTLESIQQEARSSTGKPNSQARALADRAQNNVRDLVASLSAQGQIRTAALQYLVTDNKIYIIFTTAKKQVARESTIEVEAFRRQLTAFRRILQSPHLDPKPAAQALHRLLIAPVLADIKEADAQHLMISSTDSLRYIPFAALHDGESYLMQRYQLSTMTEAAAARGMKTPVPAWSISALGVSDKVSDEFTALPAVGNELKAVVRTADNPAGALPGQIYLNASFTSEQYKGVIQNRPPVIHLATHFKFSPGTEAKSFLLLGNGKPLSLTEMMSEQYRFTNLDLLTLSACETALGGGVGENGREVEGLGAQAQRAGAGAVIATLWQVADESTFQLMQRFYSLRTSDASVNKSEAIRQAQISLIEGNIRPSSTQGNEQSITRGAARASPSREAQNFTFDANKPYAHPFYWAPFILMGNWL